MLSLGQEYFLKAEVRGFEGKLAILETEDKQQLRWPIKNLPDDVQAGGKIRLLISTTLIEKEAQEKLAKEVINSLLSE